MFRAQSLAVFFLMFALNGCAGPQSHLNTEQVSLVKKVAVVEVPLSDSPRILDHTKVWGRSYTNGMFGLAGSLLEGMVLSVQDSMAKKGSLGGDAGQFLKGTRTLTIQDQLQASLDKRLSESFELIPASRLKAECQENGGQCSVGDYLEAAKGQGADLLVYLKYVYGLAAFYNAPASAAIDSQMFVYTLPQRKIIFRKDITSNEAFKRQSTIDQFSADNFAAYKEDMGQAVDATALLVANELGLFKDEASQARMQASNDEFGHYGIGTDFMSIFAVECSRPVKMEQSCNALAGPNKRIRFGKVRASMAGSKDGKTVMVMYGAPMKMLDQIVQAAQESGIKIERATKFGKNQQHVEGYILYSDADLYSVLSKYGY